MEIKTQIEELAERELMRVRDDADAIMSIIDDRNRSLTSRINQVQMFLQGLQARNITISEIKGQIMFLDNNKQKI